LSNVRFVAEAAMFCPLRATVNGLLAALPVPSLTITKDPTAGEAGNVIVIPAVFTVKKEPDTAVVFAVIT
jgi:hypothetical protein